MPEGKYGPGREVQRISNGRLELRCTHDIEGVTPEMILWFFTHRTMERYGMWHPAHAGFRVLRRGGPDHVGDVYYIDEVFEDGRKLAVKLRVTRADRCEFAEKHLDWRQPGGISHKMERLPGGTRVRTTALFGSALPIVGAAQNYYLRKFVHKRRTFEAALSHMDEEFLNFPRFLPRLYADCAEDGAR